MYSYQYEYSMTATTWASIRAQLASMKLFDLSHIEIQYVPLGITIVRLSCAIFEAYMNLPSDAIQLTS